MSEHLLELNEENFESSIAEGVSLIDFYADWCGPCRMMTPILEELAEEMKGKVSFYKLDIDAHQQTTASMNVTSVPTLILFVDGKETERIVGLRDADSLRETIAKVHA